MLQGKSFASLLSHLYLSYYKHAFSDNFSDSILLYKYIGDMILINITYFEKFYLLVNYLNNLNLTENLISNNTIHFLNKTN